MDVKLSKTRSLKLEPIAMQARVTNGVRSFAPAGGQSVATRDIASIAAALLTEASATIFSAPVGGPLKNVAEISADLPGPKGDGAAFKDPSGLVRIVYREVTIRFGKSVAADSRRKLLDKFGLEVRRQNTYQREQIIAVDPKRKFVAERVVELANALTDTEEVEFAFPNFASQFVRHAPRAWHPEQWHLGMVKAKQAWARLPKKILRPVVVAIVDDGVDVDHVNLKGNIINRPDPKDRSDLCGRDFFVDEDDPDHYDPRPKAFKVPYTETAFNDIHGTPCAGVVAATASKDAVSGVAPRALILPVKIFHGEALATESRVAEAIRYATRFADIISCSWGAGESPDIDSAINAAATGRDGKGCPVFVATGNESEPVGYPASLPSAIAVGASNDQDDLASYSNTGPEVSVVAPSSDADIGLRSIFTTDVSIPRRGYNPGSAALGGADGLHCNDFGGTSSATPLTAGVAALLLQASPDLTAAEIRAILQSTADKIGPANSYNANGHSRRFGYGRVNADKAVAMAIRKARGGSGKPKPAKRAAKRKAPAPKRKK